MKLLTLLTFLCFNLHAKQVEVMVYNVQNLFDTKHDSGKNDWTFLPRNAKDKTQECKKIKSKYRRKECFAIDWTDERLKLKFDRIEKVVVRGKQKPDILALVEIENENVIKDLAKELGYKKFIVSNSPDRRGIDLAVLFNASKTIELVSSKEHALKGEYFKKKPSRNILEVQFKIANQDVFFFVNHWPSLGNPDSTRIVAASVLKSRIGEIKKVNSSAQIIALGDFNTIPTLKKPNTQHPFRDVLLKDSVLNDLYTTFMQDPKVPQNLKDQLPPGTYYYKRGQTWNFLDRIFISNNLIEGTGLRVGLPTFKIYSPAHLREQGKIGAPLAYNHRTTDLSRVGYSDHFPLIFTLHY